MTQQWSSVTQCYTPIPSYFNLNIVQHCIKNDVIGSIYRYRYRYIDIYTAHCVPFPSLSTLLHRDEPGASRASCLCWTLQGEPHNGKEAVPGHYGWPPANRNIFSRAQTGTLGGWGHWSGWVLDVGTTLTQASRYDRLIAVVCWTVTRLALSTLHLCSLLHVTTAIYVYSYWMYFRACMWPACALHTWMTVTRTAQDAIQRLKVENQRLLHFPPLPGTNPMKAPPRQKAGSIKTLPLTLIYGSLFRKGSTPEVRSWKLNWEWKCNWLATMLDNSHCDQPIHGLIIHNTIAVL